MTSLADLVAKSQKTPSKGKSLAALIAAAEASERRKRKKASKKTTTKRRTVKRRTTKKTKRKPLSKAEFLRRMAAGRAKAARARKRGG